MDAIIFVHPANRVSHNAVILEHVKGRLAGQGTEFKVIDLYSDGFDPILRTESGKAGYSEEVKRCQGILAASDRVIFIYPVWWYNMPAVLKGFIDRIFTSGFAFDYKLEDGKPFIRPLMNGKKAVVINTYGHGEELFRRYGKCSEKVLDEAVLGFCGFEVKRVNWFDIRKPSDIPDKIKREIDLALG